MYYVLVETSDEYLETAMYFIKKKGNENNMKHLCKQLDYIHTWEPIKNCSIFMHDYKNAVSETTAREMSRLQINAQLPYIIFDGILDKIDLEIEQEWSIVEQIRHVTEMLGSGKISRYIPGPKICNFEPMNSESEDSTSEDGSTCTSVSRKSVMNIPSWYIT